MNLTPSLPLTKATVEVEGLPIHYRTGGGGPPLLFLHGATFNGECWNPFLDAFGQHYTVIVPDMPGHGRSPRFPPEGLLFPVIARVMFGFLDLLGVGRVRGIGHSWGAGTLLTMASQQPERVEAMVPICGAHRMLMGGNWHQFAKNCFWEAWAPDKQQGLLVEHPGGRPQVEAILAAIRQSAEHFAEGEVPPERLAAIPAKTLVVYGDRDGFCPVELAVEMYRAVPNAMLWVVPGEGHTPLWSSPRVEAEFPGMVHAFFEGKLRE